MEIAAPLAAGSTLRIEIEHPCFKGLNITATVQQVRKQFSKHYAGIKFHELDDASRCGIITWIHEVETDIIDAKTSQTTTIDIR